MKLVIEIPKEYRKIKIENGSIAAKVILDAVENGIPLPKEHGRIIAEPTEEDIAKTIGGQNDFADCIREAVKAVFEHAPTIIEADKEESEE